MSKRSSTRRASGAKRHVSELIDGDKEVGGGLGGSKTRSKRTPGKATNTSSTVSTTEEPGPWYAIFTKNDEQYNRYMEEEWGTEKRGDVPLFEKLSLEGAQSGLSWLTILRKRVAYRRVFHGFDIQKVSAMTERDVQAILDETSDDSTQIVVRHRGKIESVINNAKCILKMRDEQQDDEASHGVFDKFLWSFVDDAPILNAWDGNLGTAPSKTDESVAMSKALKKLGFKFVGPTTCYALMQSVGMVIDYPVGSSEWDAALQRLKDRPGGFQDRTGK
jgi:DNA-3-methyladenine glycosylase I